MHLPKFTIALFLSATCILVAAGGNILKFYCDHLGYSVGECVDSNVDYYYLHPARDVPTFALTCGSSLGKCCKSWIELQADKARVDKYVQDNCRPPTIPPSARKPSRNI
ncbi:hypothetical protein PGTUg99_024756 [Puccinia graminis f. sp. tritici]|uniref:Uncharacterized protein n=1 Tax=Puccinia graminis f. sp. tritici TaxID=56615 RepID=A0A5B0Q1G3_PUCGR|nr:hypothetical protein PGTUg99_024756 [Puccinia graminis f. sp. tritici]